MATNKMQINVSKQETIDKFSALNPGKSNTEFLIDLLEAYEILHAKNCSDEPEDFFPNLQGKERKEKEPFLKEIFGLQSGDPLLVTENELLDKASEFSDKTIADMSKEGRVLVAKTEIGRYVQQLQGKGRKGTGDYKIAQTYEFLKQSEQKLTLNRLTQLSGSNRKTVMRWCEENNCEELLTASETK